MLIIFILVALICVGILGDYWCGTASVWPVFFIIFPGIVLFGALALVPVSYLTIQSDVVGYREIQRTISAGRVHTDPIERAAFTIKVAENNAARAQYQYLNTPWLLGLWIPDSVDDLEPMR